MAQEEKRAAHAPPPCRFNSTQITPKLLKSIRWGWRCPKCPHLGRALPPVSKEAPSGSPPPALLRALLVLSGTDSVLHYS